MTNHPWNQEPTPVAAKTKPARSCRIDMRLTVAEKKKLERKAKETRRTVTSIITELIEKMD
jgi:hypothetical protein